MDPEAARRARRKSIQRDLSGVYSDEEACPPEWLDLTTQLDRDAAELRARVEKEARRFGAEPDIRTALRRRERVTLEIQGRVVELNAIVRRINLIAPLPRFHRAPLDAKTVFKPLYRTRRPVT